jgi:glycosyltransferase involved in cell wall biosynthesis
MRVAIIAEVFLPKIDGVVNRTLNLIRHLRQAGDEVMVICPRARGCTASPAQVVHFPSFSFPLYPEYRIGLPNRRLVEEINEFKPAVLHYMNPFAFGFQCHDVLRKAGVHLPSVFSFHTLYGEFVKKYKALKPLSNVLWWLTREYHNRADINMTVSTPMQEDLIQRGFRRVELWPPAVDSDLFHPTRHNRRMRARLSNGRPERPLLLTVSRLAPEKNVGFLADVLAEVPGACLSIVGDGPYRPELERRFDGTDTHFVGYLKGEELAQAYASADAFLYASETETMGNVILEAMASGCAAVAPNAGGIPSLLAHGKTGFLYQPGDLKSAVGCTRLLLGDKEVRARLGRAARADVEERNWAHSIGRVREVYAEAVRDWRAPTAVWTWQRRVAQATTVALVSVFQLLASKKRVARRRLRAHGRRHAERVTATASYRTPGSSAGLPPRTLSAPRREAVPSGTCD